MEPPLAPDLLRARHTARACHPRQRIGVQTELRGLLAGIEQPLRIIVSFVRTQLPRDLMLQRVVRAFELGEQCSQKWRPRHLL